jgi:GDP-L-fucose synthase
MKKPHQSQIADPVLPKSARIYVAGHRGMVGSAIVRCLQAQGYREPITRSHAELDLTEQRAVNEFFGSRQLDAVFLAAARVGGIYANSAYAAEFIYQNLMIEANVIHAAFRAGIQRLLFLGSSCIYPKYAPQPMKEECLLAGPLEPTNSAYALAKIAGIRLCEAYNRQYDTHYRAVMPTNLYGPGDNFDLQTSHVLPALIRKCHLAKLAVGRDWGAIERDEQAFGTIPPDFRRNLKMIVDHRGPGSKARIPLWGTGTPRREFLHVDDLAAACVFVMQIPDDRYDDVLNCSAPIQRRGAPQEQPDGMDEPEISWPVSHINLGSGTDLTIQQLAQIILEAVHFDGELDWDSTRPDGTPRKLLDVSRLARLGWKPAIDLHSGIRNTYRWYLEQTA